MGYIDPLQSDADFIKSHAVLSKRQSREDYLVAKTEGGFDAALFNKGCPLRVPHGYSKIPGASRSGVLDPSTRSRFLDREEKGEVELARSQRGELVGYRELDHGPGDK